MKRKKWLSFIYLSALAVMLSACGGEANEGSVNTEPTTPIAETKPTAEADTDHMEAATSAPEATEESPLAEVNGSELPEQMPEGFPFPEDVTITTSTGAENESKKSVLIIFETSQSMEDVTKLYNDYFKSLKLENLGQTIDDKNIIIQGTSSSGGSNEAWSLIGGPLAAREGVIELTFTWGEL